MKLIILRTISCKHQNIATKKSRILLKTAGDGY
jgi:hypothetical protein